MAWRRLLIYIHISYGAILILNSAWSTRFLIIPISLLIVEAAAQLALLRKRIAAVILIGSFAFSLTAIFLQKDMFRDFKTTALSVKRNFPDARVFSDEQVKTSYYLGKDVGGYDRSRQLQAGDLLILHSFYSDLASEKRFLDSNYRYEVIQLIECRIIPVLGDTLGARARELDVDDRHEIGRVE